MMFPIIWYIRRQMDPEAIKTSKKIENKYLEDMKEMIDAPVRAIFTADPEGVGPSELDF